ncbi:hypothetical protein INT47_000474 [Mucor saturninus]|uniref:F-box domain-containing protein n=1 Tax=Mucor saturninus TaxID=64648 RepID=A0A8H7UQZ5_9FUNG|nr:hypothetical protein INT47_000474 [Mucor saturninus]
MDLPGELLDVIFAYVDRRGTDLYSICQCVLVCKKWKTPAQRALYLVIQLESECQIRTLLKIMGDKKNRLPGKFTQSLVFNEDFEDEDTRPWIKLFIKYFPNVRHIFSGKDDTKFYQTLIEAHNLGMWQNLKSIGTCPEDSVASHNACALLNRETLALLHVHDSHKISNGSNLYDQLELFPNVKQIYIGTNRYNFFEISEHVTKHMHKLNKVHYDILVDTNFNTLASYESVDLSLIAPQPGVKSLVIEAASYENDNFLLYLMKKYPKLQSIQINDLSSAIMSNDVLLKKIKSSKNNFSVNVLSQFMLFVSQCPIHSTDLLYTTLYTDEIFLKYWSLCGPTRPRMLAITYAEGSESWRDTETQRSNNETLAHIYMSADYRTLSNSMIIDYKSCNTVFPHLRLIEKAGKELDHLVACIGQVYYRDTRIEDDQELMRMVEGKWFSHIIQHCTKLKSLRVLQTHIVWYNSVRNFPINTFITDLTLEQVAVCQHTLRRVSYLLPNLTRIILRHIYYDKSVTNQITSELKSVIDMPLATLRFLYAQDCLLDEEKKTLLPNLIQIKLTTAKGVSFYRSVLAKDMDHLHSMRIVEDFDDEEDLEITRAIAITEAEYLDKYREYQCLSLQVNCKSIDYLVVSLKELNPELACYVLMVNGDSNTNLSPLEERNSRQYYGRENHLMGDRL